MSTPVLGMAVAVVEGTSRLASSAPFVLGGTVAVVAVGALRSPSPDPAHVLVRGDDRGYGASGSVRRGRSTQRNPMWLVPVSTICGRRAAGRYRRQ